MIMEKYGVKLLRVQQSDLEKVRMWRNSPEIQKTMHFRQHITKEAQQEWLRSVEEKKDYYFLINYNNKDLGVVNLKNIDYTKHRAETGIFIGEYDISNALVSFAAILILNNFAFDTLNLDTLTASILDNNIRAIRFNKMLGYKATEQDSKKSTCYELNKHDYAVKKTLIEKHIAIYL